METEYIDLLELQSMLREEIESSFPEQLWVRAEIASLQAKANGHCYLDLSQSEEGRIVARARAVIWRSRYAPLRAYFREATGGDPAPGMEVLLRVQVGYSELYGMTLTVEEIEPRFTLGAAELERRRTLERLAADGLLDRQKELEPALLPPMLYYTILGSLQLLFFAVKFFLVNFNFDFLKSARESVTAPRNRFKMIFNFSLRRRVPGRTWSEATYWYSRSRKIKKHLNLQEHAH